MPPRVNRDLPELPEWDAIVAAIIDQTERDPRCRDGGPTASMLAQWMGVDAARRLGNGAKGPQSWSGRMDPGLRLAPRLESMRRAGLVDSYVATGWDGRREYRNRWRVTEQGRRSLAAVRSARPHPEVAS